MPILTGATILLTGGTGSFGQMFTRYALSQNAKAIRIYSRGELLQVEMDETFKNYRDNIRYFIGDVRDKDRLSRAMEGANIVVHAAALKHVPVAEYNPLEAVKTNILGSINVVDCAIDTGVTRVIAVSTDKACHPVNLYGMTKAVMEKIFIQSNVYTPYSKGKTILSCVRYGNVAGSRGSIIPIFLKQKPAGRITITDPEMTRFWITLNQGIEFVIHSLESMRGGEIFVPKLPSMRVIDLAQAMCPECEQEVIGIRPGEKLHETLITEDEARRAREYEDCYVIPPEMSFWSNGEEPSGEPMEGPYTSGTNPVWLKEYELRRILSEIRIIEPGK